MLYNTDNTDTSYEFDDDDIDDYLDEEDIG